MLRLLLTVLALTLALPIPMAEVRAAETGDGVRGMLEALRRDEPTVRHVQRAALRYFNVNRDQVESMRSRASWKALLPVTEVSGGFARTTIGEDTVDNINFPDEIWLARGLGGDAYEVRGKLTWNLPQLMFNPEELDVASVAGLVEGILKEATRLYFMRRRLQVELVLSPPVDLATLLSKEIRLEELTALLDAMTGGWFTKEADRLKALARRTKADPAVRTVATQAPTPEPTPQTGR